MRRLYTANSIQLKRMIKMRIDEILAKKRTLSFEVFPPKKLEDDKGAIFKTIDKLKELKADFLSVTYGAGGTNAGCAVEIAGYIKSVGLEPLAHITGGPLSPSGVDELTARLSDIGVENLLALRGDRPIEYTDEYCRYFKHATDLMEYIKGDFCMGAACYPEGHPECETLYEDIISLKKKQDAGAKFLISQIFYDNSYYYRLIHEAAKYGVTVPIIPGLMPIVSAKNISGVKEMCGAAIPLDFRNMIETYSKHPNIMREIGINYTVYQIIDLIAKGAPGIHLCVMNRADVAAEIYSRLGSVFNELF